MNKLTLTPAIVGVGLALCACTPNADPTTSATQTATTTATATTTTTATQTASAAATSPASASGSDTGAPANSSICLAKNLELTGAADPDGTGAGHKGYALTVKNIGSTSCVIEQNPAVLLVTGPEQPKQIGAAATFDQGDSPRFLLPAGGTASTQLSVTNADNVPTCQATAAWGWALATAPGEQAYWPAAGWTGCADGTPIVKAKPFQLNQ